MNLFLSDNCTASSRVQTNNAVICPNCGMVFSAADHGFEIIYEDTAGWTEGIFERVLEEISDKKILCELRHPNIHRELALDRQRQFNTHLKQFERPRAWGGYHRHHHRKGL